jgi:8-oxo-dGTP diphosphatase
LSTLPIKDDLLKAWVIMSAFLHVVVGLVFNRHKQLLIARRPDHVHQGGLWEFPGGKVEVNESAFIALIREFKEEIGIVIKQADSFMEIYHQYPDKNVFLDIWISRDFDSEIIGKVSEQNLGAEGQEVKWIALTDLGKYSFPAANQEIINKLLSDGNY